MKKSIKHTFTNRMAEEFKSAMTICAAQLLIAGDNDSDIDHVKAAQCLIKLALRIHEAVEFSLYQSVTLSIDKTTGHVIKVLFQAGQLNKIEVRPSALKIIEKFTQ